MVVPNRNGGSVWNDLLGNIPGTLNFMTGTGSAWGGTPRPGGFGNMRFLGGGNLSSNAGASQNRIDLPAYKLTTSGCSVSCWMKGATTSFDSSHGAILFCHGLASSTTSSGVRLDANAFSVFHNFSANTGAQVSFTPPPGGVWNHICAVWDGTSAAANLAVYINGQAVTTAVVINTLNTTTFTTNSGKLVGRIGGQTFDSSGGFQGYWAGSLDCIEEWSRPLSANEVAHLYNISQSGYGGLLSYPSPLSQYNIWKQSSAILQSYYYRMLTGN